MFDTQSILMLAAGALLLLNGLIAQGVKPEAGTDSSAPAAEGRETQNPTA